MRVYETIDPLRGLLVRGLLGSEGIPVLATGEATGPYRMGPAVLWVSEDDAGRARELIEASEAGRLTLRDDEAPDVEPIAD